MATTNDVKRLHKSRTDRMVDGVCGGVARYLGVDSTLVRILWVLLTIMGGSGVVLYIVAMIIMPAEPMNAAESAPKPVPGRNEKFWGFLLVTVGAIWLLGNFGIHFWHHWWGFSWDVMLPVLLILAGVAFLFGGRNSLTGSQSPEATETGHSEPPGERSEVRRLHKSRDQRKVFGVCGGLAEYLNIDPTIVRLLFIISLFASFGFTLLLYVIMAIVVPKETTISQA